MAHRMIEEGTNMPVGDPAKVAAIIIASADHNSVPKRIALGSDAYGVMCEQLSERLAALEALAFSTDFPTET